MSSVAVCLFMCVFHCLFVNVLFYSSVRLFFFVNNLSLCFYLSVILQDWLCVLLMFLMSFPLFISILL